MMRPNRLPASWKPQQRRLDPDLIVWELPTRPVIEQLRRTDRFVIEYLEHVPQGNAAPVGLDRVRHHDPRQDPLAERDSDAGARSRQRQRLRDAVGEIFPDRQGKGDGYRSHFPTLLSRGRDLSRGQVLRACTRLLIENSTTT